MSKLFHTVRCGLIVALLLTAGAVRSDDTLDPVGIHELEFSDRDRRITLYLYYPAGPDGDARQFEMPHYTNLSLYRDAPLIAAEDGYPLVLLSHGKGLNGLMYAWFGEYLAARGYIVAAINHYRANTYDNHIAYRANRLWQRPVDIRLAISFLLGDQTWGPQIDADRIGVAGHSQGGLTALWVGGAEVNAETFMSFQRRWRDNRTVPERLRRQLAVDAAPALDVRDERVKAIFAMAPSTIQKVGMDAAGLERTPVPAYLTVGAGDTQAPPGDNAAFAASHVPLSELSILLGPVGHQVFLNECSQRGRNEMPGDCTDAPGVDRAAIHRSVGGAAVTFFDRLLAAASPH